MIALTSAEPNTMPMHLWAPPPNGMCANRWPFCSLRGATNRSMSKSSGFVQIVSLRWVGSAHDRDQRALRHEVAADVHVLGRLAAEDGHRRHQPHALHEDPVDDLELVEQLERDRLPAQRLRLGPGRLLELGVLRQVVGDRRRGDGGRVVGGHHQEDHVVDDVVVGELLAVLGAGVAQRGEQVVTARGTLGGDLGPEVVLEHLAPGQPLVPPQPRRARHPHPDDAGAGPDGIDERAWSGDRSGAGLRP